MISMSYLCTDTSCSETCPDDHLILVSAGYHAMSPVVVLLLFILGLIHCACPAQHLLFSSLATGCLHMQELI